MASNTLTELLIEAQSADSTARTAAEKNLVAAEERDLAHFLRELSIELTNKNSPEIARQLAGLLLKNAISGTDRKIDKAKRSRWVSVPSDVTALIKQNAFETLSSDCDPARSAACQVLAKIGRVEIPMGSWKDLVTNLLTLVMADNASARKGALITYGYLCEDLQLIAEEMQGEVDMIGPEDCNRILTGVVTGMKDADIQVKLVATRALYHAVVFAYDNIQNEEERSYLLAAVGQNLRCSDVTVQQAAWECVLQIASEYYEILSPYMNELGTLALETIKTGSEMAALPAVEFWNNICDEEIAILNGTSDRPMLHFIAQAKDYLLPVLFEVMTRQTSEETEAGDWTLAMAAGTCVGLCAEVLCDDILELTLQFVNASFGHAEWQRREAAVFAYGSIMQGPTSDKLQPLVQGSFTTLCQSLNDSSVAVRDTTAWTVGRIAKFHFSCIAGLLGTIEEPGLIQILLSKLNDDPRVAAQICFAIHEIASNCGSEISAATGRSSTPMDVWLQPIVEALYHVAQRSDSDEHKLRTGAYTALGEVITDLQGPEKTVIVNQLYQNILSLLENSVNQEECSDEISQLQMELCGCIETSIRVLEPQCVLMYAERTFNVFMRVLYGHIDTSKTDAATPFSIVAEDALMAISALALNLGENFAPFAPRFCQALHQGLENREDEQLCEKCIDIAGDLSRSLGRKFSGAHYQLIMQDLYLTLKDTTAKVALKPKAMQTLGDVAFNIGSEFACHLEWCLDLLRQAALTRVEHGPMDNDEWMEFIRKLRDGVLWAYEGVFLGLQTDHKIAALKSHLPTMIEFIQLIFDDPTSSDSNILKAVELLCDLLTGFPEIGVNLRNQRQELYKKMLQLGETHTDAAIQRQTKVLENLVNRPQAA